jgi:23S rRNA-/tRNA-specific pseudouridylate synthase
VIESGVLVDGVAREKSWRLRGGEDVEFAPSAEAQPPQREELELSVAYEDEHLLVVDKPAGLVVHPAPGHTTGTLVHGLLALGRLSLRGRRELHVLPASKPPRLLPCDAVDVHTRLDHALGGCPRADVCRDERVEPRTGGVVRNPNVQGGLRRAARAAGSPRRRR